MRTWGVVIGVVLLALAGYAVLPREQSEGPVAQEVQKESVYERILRTKKIRCAYIVWPPFLGKDATTGKMSGVYYDILTKIGEDWGVEIDWAEEVGAGDRFAGFVTGRYDMICAPTGYTPQRAAVSDFSIPIYYQPFYLYARADDHRFDEAYDKADQSDVTFMSLEGYMGESVIKSSFPKARYLALPNLSTDVDVLLSIAMGKADLTAAETCMAGDFIDRNPGKIRRVSGKPLRVAAGVIPVPMGQEKLKARLNTTLAYYLDTGFIDKVMTANGLSPEKVLRVAVPYRLTE